MRMQNYETYRKIPWSDRDQSHCSSLKHEKPLMLVRSVIETVELLTTTPGRHRVYWICATCPAISRFGAETHALWQRLSRRFRTAGEWHGTGVVRSNVPHTCSFFFKGS
jgi:hypothetical protein